MVIKKSFKLLVASGITRFFAIVSIISVNGSRNDAEYSIQPIDTTRCHEKFYKQRFRSHFNCITSKRRQISSYRNAAILLVRFTEF